MGELKIVEIVSANDKYLQRDILSIAAMTEIRSGHIISKAILQKASEEKIVVRSPDTYEYITGHGVVVTSKGQRCVLGSRHFIQESEHENIKIPTEMLCPESMLHTSFYLCCNNELIGRICVTDVIRQDAQKTILKLKNLGIKTTVLLSGDKKEIAKKIGGELGVDISYGEADPEQKLNIIKKLQSESAFVTMVGDGINDAPALRQANVGIAMGAMGTEPAIEAADVVLMRNNLEDIVFVIQLSLKVFRLIKQNIIFGFVFIHLVGTILAFLHLIAPIHATIAHSFVDLFILINSARLIEFKSKNYSISKTVLVKDENLIP
jgi:Cd2+/Zn2+-exporting ATPase